jgi:hypothetical protein
MKSGTLPLSQLLESKLATKHTYSYQAENGRDLSLKNLKKSYVLPHMWTLDQGQTQQWDWTMST